MRQRLLTASTNPARNSVVALVATLAMVLSPLNPNQRVVNAQRSAVTTTTANTWMSVGPDGAEVLALAVDPTNPSIVYAGSNDNEIFKSTDGGGTWNQALTEPNFGFVQTLTVARNSPSTIYAGGGNGVSESLDGGAHWAPATSGVSDWTFSIAVDPNDSATVYAGTLSGVFKTTNGGAIWQPVLPAGFVHSVAIDPTNPAIVYAGSDGTGVFKSADGGQIWTRINSSPIVGFAIDPSSPATLYATEGPSLVTPLTTMKSTDGGATWTSHAVRSDFLFAIGNNLLVDPNNSATIYGATSGGQVVKSTDSGASFTEVISGMNLCAGGGGGIAIDPDNSAILYAGSGGAGVYKTTNGGQTWAPANSGLAGSRLLSLVMDPSHPRTIYAAGRFGGVYKSTDGGGSWTEPTSGLALRGPFGELVLSEIDAIALDPTDPSTLYAGGFQQGVFKSTDAGASWIQMNSGLTDQSVSVLAVDPRNPETVYAGTLDRGKVFKTTDGGASWQDTNLQTPQFSSIYCMAIDPASTANVYAGSDGGSVFNSTDGGLTWGLTNSGITSANVVVSSLVIDPRQPSTIYAGVRPGGLFKSTDSGRSWSPINTGFTYAYAEALAIDPSNSSTVYAGSFDGVYISADAGNTWSQIRSGLDSVEVSALAIDPTNSLNVFAVSSWMGAFNIHLTPDFQLGLANQTITVAAGTKTPVEVIVGRLADFAKNVTVTASAIQGIKLKPHSLSTTGSSVTFKLKVSSKTPAGTYDLQITGVGGGVQRSVVLHVQVDAAGT